MDQVVKAVSPEEFARVEARNKFNAEQAALVAKGLPKFVDDSDGTRKLVIPLQFPVEWGGEVIKEVTMRRPVMREWRGYLRDCADAVKVAGPGADDMVDQPWLSVPAIVLENLDVMDATAVEAAQEGFFARSSPANGSEKTTTENPDESPSTSTTGNP
jgi:hypothetical protein